MSPSLRTLASAAALLGAAVPAAADELLWNQGIDSQGIVESYRSTTSTQEIEAADDFELVASVERLIVRGYLSFMQTQTVQGVRVAFYEWTPGGPGALLQEASFGPSDPGLIYDGTHPETFEVRLPSAFQASGKHFVSFQLLSPGQAAWRWWTSHTGGWTMSTALDRANGGAWGPIEQITGPVQADLSFALYGDDATPPPPSSDPCGAWVEDVVPMLPNTQHCVLRDVVAISADDVWAVAAPLVGPSPTVVDFKAHSVHWDGSSWSVVPTPTPEPYPGAGAGLWGVDASGPDDVWAVGDQKKQDANGFVGSQVLVMRWDGSQWQVMSTPVTDLGYSGAFGRGVEALAPDDVWFVGDWPGTGGQLPMLLHWDGAGFQQHGIGFSPPGPLGLEAVSAVSPDDVWAVGGGGDGDDAAYSVILHWDGSTWSYVPGPMPGLFGRMNDVVAIAADDVWATGHYFDGLSYHTLMLHWDGASWTQVATPGGSLGLAAMGPDAVYACGGGVFRWDGASWSQVEDFHSVPDVALSAIDLAGPCELFSVGRKIQPDIVSFAAHVLTSGAASYCQSLPNSSGLPARMGHAGSVSLGANDLRLLAHDAPPGQNGLFFFGQNAVEQPFGDGFRCVGSPAWRLGVVGIGAGGTAERALSLPQPKPNGPTIEPGSTWRFQLWYRDPGFGAFGFNLSDGLALTFAP